jgi:hypothetical protein
VEGGVESTLWGDVRKDQQRMVGGKAGTEEIGDALKTERESLSKIPRAAPTNQTNKTRKKQWQGKG